MKFNEDRFGLEDDFNEDNYTTPLNIAEFSKEEINEAQKLAMSIEKSELQADLNNRHMREERNQQPLVDNEDEEDLYSAVVRKPKDQAVEEPREVKTTPSSPAQPQKSASPERPKFQVRK